MTRDESRPPGKAAPESTATKTESIVAEHTDPLPVALTIGATLEDVMRRAEIDDANNRWWYRFGYEVGRSAGKAEAEDEIARIRLDREEISRQKPTGETCPCGRGMYRRRAS